LPPFSLWQQKANNLSQVENIPKSDKDSRLCDRLLQQTPQNALPELIVVQESMPLHFTRQIRNVNPGNDGKQNQSSL
jgi:hypothetical protein